ncbi:helicase, putative [Plasmodium malariae]|uniref:Helicase, putative n=1 Tax=Plasmodium malariae TaxID=5858 RepID=A0A1C3L0S0_PLAMA|nr:helicase, putative [Plasmodium malariae]
MYPFASTVQSYKDIVHLDNAILNELKISKTGNNSSINDVKRLYRSVNGMNSDTTYLNYGEKNFEYYCVPPSIIKEYNNLGVYELYKEQAQCLREIFLNEDFEHNLKKKKSEIEIDEKEMDNIDIILKSGFFFPFEILKEKSAQWEYLRNTEINEYDGDKKWEIIHTDNIQGTSTFYKNFLFNIPTGMGKTIIYDIIIIRLVLYKGYRAVLSLPTISLINEKNEYYEKLLGDNTVSLNIKKYNSFDFTGYSYSLSTDIAICTYEQANIIINNIIKNNLKCNYIFIIDEIHFINDMTRGIFIESLLTKIKYIQKNCGHIFNIQTYGFSATLSNIDLLGEWLDAKVYVSKEKLQKIKYLYKIGKTIYKDLQEKEIERVLESPFTLDPDHLGYILSEELIFKRNVLIFCPTKKKSEQVATFISTIMPCYLKKKKFKINNKIIEKRIHLIIELKKIASIKSVDIEKLILNGIFYHHSELGKKEKEIIEKSFKGNILFCLCCTTTLSVGVNLNVHTILIRSIKLGNTFLTKEQIFQIAGRCGRTRKFVQMTKENINKEKYESKDNSINSNLNNFLESGCKTQLKENILLDKPEHMQYYDLDCDGKVVFFLTPYDKNYLEKILYHNEGEHTLKTKMHNFQLCKFLVEFIELNLIKTKRDLSNFLTRYTLKFFKIGEAEEGSCSRWSDLDMHNNCYSPNPRKYNCKYNCVGKKAAIVDEIKEVFQFMFENKLIIIPYEKEWSYYCYLFARLYNVNLLNEQNIFDFNFLNRSINVDILMKNDLPQKMDLFKKLYIHHHNNKHNHMHNRKYSNSDNNYNYIFELKTSTTTEDKHFFSLPFITLLLLFKDTQFNKNLFQNLFVQFIKYLFLVNINIKQYDFYVYDMLKDDDVISCTHISPYVHSVCNSLAFLFNYSLIQYVYVKGFPMDILPIIFVFCVNSEISLKINYAMYEEIVTSNSISGNNIRKIFHFFDLNTEKLKKFKLTKSDDLHVASKNILIGDINIDQICESFEWEKIKRFYFSLIVYDLFSEDIYSVSKKYKLKTKELKNLYVKSCYNLSFNYKILRNFKDSLDIFCGVLEKLLSKMKSRIFPFIT